MNILKIILTPLFFYYFLMTFLVGMLGFCYTLILLVTPVYLLVVWVISYWKKNQPSFLSKAFRQAILILLLGILIYVLDFYRHKLLYEATNQAASFAQNYYHEYGIYPKSVPVPFIWSLGPIPPLLYYVPKHKAEQQATISQMNFLFSSRMLYLDAGKISESNLD